ncbi:hypothetical protein B0H11DRAFT_1933785 [Mycena galericulata]|nr:hypothetical protein B0H11DRAFT_1933785 [Mycena galericulata]
MDGIDPIHFLHNTDPPNAGDSKPHSFWSSALSFSDLRLLALNQDPRVFGTFPHPSTSFVSRNIKRTFRLLTTEKLLELERPLQQEMHAYVTQSSYRERDSAYIFQKDARDLACRVSGQRAPDGSRGYNFNGLEVAHVFPFASANQFPEAFRPATHGDMYRDLGMPKQPRKSHLDIVANTFLPRADIHLQFDAYEFGFEISYDAAVFSGMSRGMGWRRETMQYSLPSIIIPQFSWDTGQPNK